MECLARRKLADYLVVALLHLFSPSFSVMSSQSAALTSIAHLVWGEMIYVQYAQSLFGFSY